MNPVSQFGFLDSKESQWIPGPLSPDMFYISITSLQIFITYLSVLENKVAQLFQKIRGPDACNL